MALDIQLAQSPPKKQKKDRKHNDRDSGTGDLAVTEKEERRKKRKERKEKREGAIDSALSSRLLCRGLTRVPLYAHTVVEAKNGKERKKSTAILADEPGACYARPSKSVFTFGAGSCTEPEKSKRKKEKKSRKDADSDLISVPESRKTKKRKSKHDQVSDAAPPGSPPASPKRPRVTISPAEAEAYLKAHNITVHLSPGISALSPITSFDALPIPDSLRSAFSAFKDPTPIQACAWPPALSGKDVVGIAETGSGKTLAFGIPALARLLSPPGDVAGKGPRALVIAPTRELALQTYDALNALDAVQCVAVFGGIDKAQQARAINNGVQVVVGTPGRVLDLIRDGVLALGGVEYLVLDEADRMLDKGFENDIRSIIGHTKPGAARQTLMCTSIHVCLHCCWC